MRNLVIYLSVWIMLTQTGCQSPKGKTSDYQSLNQSWEVISSEAIEATGEQLSQVAFEGTGWYRGDLPATVFAILRQNNLHTNIFMGDSMDLVDKTPFQKPWWYRKTFNIEEAGDLVHYQLQLEGLNYKANIWLNGQLIADSTKIEGAFGRWNFDVSKHLTAGSNALAIEVIPPKKGDLTIGFVDWNPAAPDNNMGLWRGVYLKKTGAISLESPFVQTKLSGPDNHTAELTVSVYATNLDSQSRQSTIRITTPQLFELSQQVTLEAGETREIKFNSEDYPQLTIKNPALWWPLHMGEPVLHNLVVTAQDGGMASDELTSRYGIREVAQYLNANGDKGYKINGQPILIKGGGWVDDVFLSDDDEKVKAQVAYVKHMNMNTIRLEGFWGKNKTLYDACDENGILLMIGWSCQWEWEPYCGRPETNFMAITGEEEMVRHTQSYVEQVKYLRNHPSIFLWVFGSDKLPLPQLESMLNSAIGATDPSRPLLASCKYQDFGTDFYNTSEVSGPTGVKMLGPYNYVPPVYWYIDTIAGGAYGFNTETGPGPQVPPLESIVKMIPQDKLWPINDMWNYHCGRHEFGSLDHFLEAFINRYGAAEDLETFAFKVQMSNYEAMRPMFEAFQVNHGKATGVIQWMLNSAWPEFYWQLYDYYLMPTGAFYGARKGCQPLNIVYHYGDHSIYLVNEHLQAYNDVTVQVQLFDTNSKEIYKETLTMSAKAASVGKATTIPEELNLPATYFAALKLMNGNGELLADNFYWLSSKPDVMAFEKTRWVTTPIHSFADLTGLNNLPKVSIESTMQTTKGTDHQEFKIKLKNPNQSIAFFIELSLVDEETGQTFLPVLWSDNYVSLIGHETKELTAKIPNCTTSNRQVALRIKGWNVN